MGRNDVSPTVFEGVLNAALFVAALLFLLGSWWLLFHVSAAWTGLLLVPWDVALERPPLGSWERTVNDFFEDPMGEKLFSVPLLLVSGAALLLRIRGANHRTSLIFGFALTSLLASMLSYPVLMVGLMGKLVLAYIFPVSGLGFHYTLFPVALMTAFFVGLLAIQARIPIEWLIYEPEQAEA